MKRVLIVDDDTIVRITLRSLINWEAFGYQVAGDAIHGKQALRYLEEGTVDLVITDMKMPVMDGLGLIEQIHRLGLTPKILVLSGYDDFKLVREAFRMGAEDYLLKSDLSAGVLEKVLLKIGEGDLEAQEEEKDQEGKSRKEGFKGEERKNQEENGFSRGQLLVDMAMGRRALERSLFSGEYVVIQFEIEDVLRHMARFSHDPEGELVRPFLSFARQIPRVASRCVLGSISPSRYVMLYQVGDARIYRENVVSTCRQLMNVWKNYMNLPVAVGVSEKEDRPEEFWERLEESGEQLRLRYLKRQGQIGCIWEKGRITCRQAEKIRDCYDRLLQGLFFSDEMMVDEEKPRLFAALYEAGISQAICISLCLIEALAWKLEENQDDIRRMFSEEIDYYEKLGRFCEVRELELWLNNYFRWILDYQKHKQDRSQEDLILKARRFILDNYSNPELTLGSVADYVGLNEKYFSTKFTKEEGMTFSNFLTEVRIRKARELMEQTNLKVYEISRSVGYNSVEHFTRVFKRICKVSPGSYKQRGM